MCVCVFFFMILVYVIYVLLFLSLTSSLLWMCLQACGFELLVCSAGGVTPSSTPTTTTTAPEFPTQPPGAPDPRWLRYHKALAEKGYFRVRGLQFKVCSDFYNFIFFISVSNFAFHCFKFVCLFLTV